LRILGEFQPTGNVDDDMPKIRAYYAGITGLRPENT